MMVPIVVLDEAILSDENKRAPAGAVSKKNA
jgi:hypothetical protein